MARRTEHWFRRGKPSGSRTFLANLLTRPSGQATRGVGNCLIYMSNVDRPRGVVLAPLPVGQNLSLVPV